MHKFDYKGYSEDTLFKLCCGDSIVKSIAKSYYWTAEVYSFGKHIREYSFYPSIFPLYVYTDHGPGYYSDEVAKHELEHDACCQFYHSSRCVNLFKKVSNKPSYTMLSPFVMYRRKKKINKSKTAKGTLAFPVHTTPGIDDFFDIELYIQQLKTLPEEFQPVSVCLHMHDIAKDRHKIFMKHGLPVYTAGNAYDYRFAERFYDILKNFKYSTSNIVGSYTYYSIEMGIPFSIYGCKPILINNSDPNLERGEYKLQENQFYQKVFKMFEGLNKEITLEQKEFVEKNLGVYDGLSRFEMAKVLYSAYFKRGNLIRDLFYPGWKCLIENPIKELKRQLV